MNKTKNMKGTWHGQESICQPVNLKSNLLPYSHWPADRLLAMPGPFHVYYQIWKKLDFLLLEKCNLYYLILCGSSSNYFYFSLKTLLFDIKLWHHFTSKLWQISVVLVSIKLWHHSTSNLRQISVVLVSIKWWHHSTSKFQQITTVLVSIKLWRNFTSKLGQHNRSSSMRNLRYLPACGRQIISQLFVY